MDGAPDTLEGISAVLLAAGESRRMGHPKMLLPWGGTTVLGRVIDTFSRAGMPELLVVTGAWRMEIEAEVNSLSGKYPVKSVFNPGFQQGEMLSSIQCGLSALPPGRKAALIGLGDQPFVREDVIRNICNTFHDSGAPLVIPSFQYRRGHPWLVARSFWGEILALPPDATPRQFIQAHDESILYLNVPDDSILRDIDTPEDYQEQRP